MIKASDALGIGVSYVADIDFIDEGMIHLTLGTNISNSMF